MDELIFWPPSWSMLLLLPALFLGFTVHEIGHAIVALLLGDSSQLERRRLSLNPLRHVSWIGLVVFLLFGFGWAKPVQVDISRFRMKNRALGMFVVSIAGAAANMVTAVLALLGMVLHRRRFSGQDTVSRWFALSPGNCPPVSLSQAQVCATGYLVSVTGGLWQAKSPRTSQNESDGRT